MVACVDDKKSILVSFLTNSGTSYSAKYDLETQGHSSDYVIFRIAAILNLSFPLAS